MPRNNKSIPSQVQKKVYQEANSSCAFCHEDKTELLEMHHITPRSENGSNKRSNLILVCRNCHSEIENGLISEKEVLKTKKLLQQNVHQIGRKKNGHSVNIDGPVTDSYVANTINIQQDKNNKSKTKYPDGCIGANLQKKNYIRYLVKRYFDFREADKSFGRERKFNPAVLHKNIENKFKARTYFINENKFEELVEYLQNRIDRTILAKRNKSKGRKSYRSFESYLEKYG
jgi:hypothetical protein